MWEIGCYATITMEDRLFFGGVHRIGDSCIAVARPRVTRARPPPSDFNDHASDISGDGNVRTLFITDRFCPGRDNFGGYRDNITAAIHYAEYRALTLRTCTRRN